MVLIATLWQLHHNPEQMVVYFDIDVLGARPKLNMCTEAMYLEGRAPLSFVLE
jgi:hypothetical protein